MTESSFGISGEGNLDVLGLVRAVGQLSKCSLNVSHRENRAAIDGKDVCSVEGLVHGFGLVGG